MKICLITNLFKPYEDWPKLYPETIADELSRENEVVVITPKPFSGLSSLRPSIESQDGVKIYRFYPLNMYYLSYPARYHPLWMKMIWHLIDIWNPHSYFVIKKILRREKPDVVHTLNLSGLSTSVFAAVKSSGYPHVHFLQDCALISPWAALLRNSKMIMFNFFDRQYIKIRRLLSKSASIILAESRFALDIHLQNGYFKNCPFYISPYPSRIRPSSFKGKSYSPIDILFVGAIAKDKGIYVLLDAFKKLDRNDINLHLVGTGPDLDNLARQANSLDNVYIHGFKGSEDLAKIYSQANITVVPSICYDNFPAVMAESFSFGTPVVGSKIGGIPEAIIDGVNGRLFEPGDSSTLIDILQDLIDNQDKLKEMEAGALKSAEEYRIEKYITHLLKVYRSLEYDCSKTERKDEMRKDDGRLPEKFSQYKKT